MDWSGSELFGVCDLYSTTAAQDAIRDIARAMEDRTGNLPPSPASSPTGRRPAVASTEGV